jgi:glutamate/tyrosine decarboxylase-like PLP-dependent enzyme
MEHFPTTGTSWPDLEAELVARRAGDPKMDLGLKGPDDADAVARAAHQLYFNVNAMLGPRIPSISHITNDIYAWVIDLMHGGPDARASMTTGGSESIICAVHAMREWARATRPHITQPEVVVPYSAHAAFSKAAHYLGLTLTRVPVGPDKRADVAAIADAITPNTIGLVGSAPCWPYGLYDPIPELGTLARDSGLWLHVDACVGGFVAPFAEHLGYHLPEWDLRVPGVCSISADLHKYGFAPLPASIVVYASEAHKQYQPYVVEDWPTGPYRTETMVGSRQGGALAAAWAVFRYLGRDGFVKSTARILDVKERLTAGINEIPGLAALDNDPPLLVYGATGARFNTDAVAAGLRERGWFIFGTLEPPLINLPLNPADDLSVETYLTDLEAIVAGLEEGVRATGELHYAS